MMICNIYEPLRAKLKNINAADDPASLASAPPTATPAMIERAFEYN